MIKVECKLQTYPPGSEPQESVTIRSTGYTDRVYVKIGEKEVILIGRHVIDAIGNAMRISE